MKITYDQEKRLKTLAERGLDFEDARYVFDEPNIEIEDKRKAMAKFAWSATACCRVEWWSSDTRRVARIAMSSV